MSDKLGSILLNNARVGGIDISHSNDGYHLYADQIRYGCYNNMDIHIDSFDKVIQDNFETDKIFGRLIDVEINLYPSDKYETIYNSWIESDDPRISKIQKVIVNGPATIIIDHRGNKTIVKCQDDLENYDPVLGFGLCLLRYILDKKKYHDIMMDLFDRDLSSKRVPFMVRAILDSHLGHKETGKIFTKFIEDNHFDSPSLLYKKIGDTANKEMKKQFKKNLKKFKENCDKMKEITSRI